MATPFSQRNLITSVVVCSWCSNTHCCTHDAAGEVRTGKLIELLLLAMGLSFNTICDQICGSIGWCPNFATEICILSRRVPEIFTSKGMFKFKSLGWFLRKISTSTGDHCIYLISCIYSPVLSP